MYGIDESKANTTYADGYGRFCAIVATTHYEGTNRVKAWELINIELGRRGEKMTTLANIAKVRDTDHGTSIYREI